MARGKEIWEAAGKVTSNASARSANAMRFYALSRMLVEAETSASMGASMGSDAEAARQLRELQAHAEKLAAMLAADQPDQVAA